MIYMSRKKPYEVGLKQSADGVNFRYQNDDDVQLFVIHITQLVLIKLSCRIVFDKTKPESRHMTIY